MQLECELCGAHYRADILDAHVQSGRLTFTCKSCGREVVVVGNAADKGPRDAVLLFDAAEQVELESLPEPPPEPAPEHPPERAPEPDSGPRQASPAALPAPFQSPPADPDRSLRRFWIGIGCAGLVAAAVYSYLRLETREAPLPQRRNRVELKEESRPLAPLPAVASPVASLLPPSGSGPAASHTPSSEAAPAVQVVEVPGRPASPEARSEAGPAPKPTSTPRVPVSKKEGGLRDATSVLDRGAIDVALVRARPFYKLCAVTEIKRDPEAHPGVVVASVTIVSSGAVNNVILAGGIAGGSPLEACVRDALSRMTFPPFEGAPILLRRSIDLDVPLER